MLCFNFYCGFFCKICFKLLDFVFADWSPLIVMIVGKPVLIKFRRNTYIPEFCFLGNTNSSLRLECPWFFFIRSPYSLSDTKKILFHPESSSQGVKNIDSSLYSCLFLNALFGFFFPHFMYKAECSSENFSHLDLICIEGKDYLVTWK